MQDKATVAKTLVVCVVTALLFISISGCDYLLRREPGIGKPVKWTNLPNWSDDRVQEAWTAIDAQCPLAAKKDEDWVAICIAVSSLVSPAENQMRAFLQEYFVPHVIYGKYGKRDGLITGYYEPILNGSLTPSERYAYPVYSAPEEMLTIELADLYPSLEGMRLRGRVEGSKVVPFFSREEIDGDNQPLKGKELLWIDDAYGSFFLQIQGSGRVRLDDGKIIGVNYENQNGHPYVAIGKTLVENQELALEDVSLFTIRDWLEKNPQRADAVLNSNPSYVFFHIREDSNEGPRGSLNVPLTAERSLAVDRKVIPLGTPVWIDTTLPDGSPYQRLMIAQDTGGAIRGPVRADVFFGNGQRAERLAGEMNQKGRLYALLPAKRP